jgi:folylpolyglutamate synthase/dihydropteroate synthase
VSRLLRHKTERNRGSPNNIQQELKRTNHPTRTPETSVQPAMHIDTGHTMNSVHFATQQ